MTNQTQPSNDIKSVCVFCGSSAGKDERHIKAARQLGDVFVANNWTLIYGGGTTGIMGALANQIATNGGKVIGIIPKALISREQNGETPDKDQYGETIIVDDMHTRKRMMAQRSDAFIALPGGYGTAEEFFEITTWNQLGIHCKPILVLNVAGFYDGLLQWISSAVDQGFIRKGHKNIVSVVNEPAEVTDALTNYREADERLNLNWSSE